MFQAELRGKLRRLEQVKYDRLEDLLTSYVFGAARYLPFEAFLLPLLRRARRIDGTALDIDGFEVTHLLFWPRIPNVGEPDVAVIGQREGYLEVVIVEAKLFSGKSTSDATVEDEDEELDSKADQVADYLLGVIDCGLRGSGVELDGSALVLERTAVVYLTAHSSPPAGELRKTQERCWAKGSASASERVYWLSWSHAIAAAREGEAALSSPGQKVLAQDIVQLLLLRGFRAWEGWTSAPPRLGQRLWAEPWFSATPPRGTSPELSYWKGER